MIGCSPGARKARPGPASLTGVARASAAHPDQASPGRGGVADSLRAAVRRADSAPHRLACRPARDRTAGTSAVRPTGLAAGAPDRMAGRRARRPRPAGTAAAGLRLHVQKLLGREEVDPAVDEVEEPTHRALLLHLLVDEPLEEL